MNSTLGKDTMMNIKEKHDIKVGIITYHNASNYGAVLQAYALQEAIKKITSNVEIIDYDNRFITKGLDLIRVGTSIREIYYTLSDILNYKNRSEKIRRFREFFRDYYNLSLRVTKNELLSGKLHYDVGVSGSDQIWNPALAGDVDPIYLLNFPGISKKISYASSLGAYHFDDEKENENIKKYLSEYEQVSVRDNPEKLANLLGRKVLNHCDPTLLLSKEEWKNKLSITEKKESYILVYCLTDFDRVISLALQIGKTKGIRVKVIGDTPAKKRGVDYITDAGPKEFVSVLYNAEYVITNSFHGTVFAANFGIPFISIRNEHSPERAAAFMKEINAECRLLTVEEDDKVIINLDKVFNYENIIGEKREMAMKYLGASIFDYYD